MSEIKVDKLKGLQVGASGPEVTFDSAGNLTYDGNANLTGDTTIDDATISSRFVLPNYTTAQRDALTGVSLGQVIYNTQEEVIQIWVGGNWADAGGIPLEVTTTGTVTPSSSGGYNILRFTGDGSMTVSGGPVDVDVLLVGGGAGGGSRNAGPDSGGTDGGSGGGAGGWVQVTGRTLQDGTYPISVGGGGSAAASPGSQQPGGNGSPSTFDGLVAYGGGYGACGPGNRPGGPGGSGGGAGGGGGSPGSGGTATQPGAPGLSGSNGHGNNGGPNPNQACYSGSGGGGASGVGATGGNGRQAPGGTDDRDAWELYSDGNLG